MKIALIHPKITYVCENAPIQDYVNQWYKDIFSRAFNHNLLRLASLTPRDHDIFLIDENYREIDFEARYDVVAVTAMTYQVERAYQIAKAFKDRGPCHTILGGIHASVQPFEAGDHFDSVCVGEVENIWGEFLSDLAAGKARKFYLGTLARLEEIPKLDYSFARQWTEAETASQLRFFPVMSTRGCPRGCDYCSATYLFEKKYRKKSVERVISEVRNIKTTAAELGISQFHVEFCDDNFIVDRRHAKELLAQLAGENITFTASIDIAASDDPEILELLGAGGCKIVSIGLESLEVNILEDLGQWKKSQRAKVERNIRAYFDYGIVPAVNFMVGSDGTDRQLFGNIRKFIQEFPVVYNLLFFTPFPGTPHREVLQKAGRLRADKSWSDYNLFNLVFEPKGMTKEELYDEFFAIRSEYDHLRQFIRSQKCLRNSSGGVNKPRGLLPQEMIY